MKLGLIGCGWVTETLHLPALRALPAVEVVAAADRDPHRLHRVAQRFHIPHRYADHRAVLDDPSIDAVGVWVPPDAQVELAQAVLGAGKHLFIEKPLVFGFTAWERVAEQAERSGRRIMVGLPRRWHRLVRRAHDTIRRGTLGKLELIRTVLTGGQPEHLSPRERDDQRIATGILFHHGIHHFDLWHFLLGGEVDEIFSARSSAESAAVVSARLSGDVLATSTFAEGGRETDEIEIYGRAGGLRVSCHRFDGFEYLPPAGHPGDIRTRARQALHSLRELPHGVLTARHGGDFVDSYRRAWQHFVNSIRSNSRPECTLEEGCRALRVVLAARESAAGGRPVKVAQPSNVRP